jgi:hypothetical protein
VSNSFQFSQVSSVDERPSLGTRTCLILPLAVCSLRESKICAGCNGTMVHVIASSKGGTCGNDFRKKRLGFGNMKNWVNTGFRMYLEFVSNNTNVFGNSVRAKETLSDLGVADTTHSILPIRLQTQPYPSAYF